MIDPRPMIFIHGLDSSSQGEKAILLRKLFPGILTPDFRGTLEERMEQLYGILGNRTGWKIIGSSFGGLMATIFACQRPHQVERLILFAPALIWPDFANSLPPPISLPVTTYHGVRDEIIPLDIVRKLAEQVFRNLNFLVVDDDHGLYKTVHAIDWRKLLASQQAQ